MDSTVVRKMTDGSWHAVWRRESRLLAEFDGPRQDAIDWARSRSPHCWVYSEELGDVMLLNPNQPG
jgi:hypothetical protein